jgi:hypothetical protein
MKTSSLAFDRASVRSYDQDGRLRVEITNISKANVCPYQGSEIPGAEELGLDPNKVYMLLRDPDELAKAAPSYNGVPVLLKHEPTSADDHPREITVGTTATNAVFEKPYLRIGLVIWDGEAIRLIESDEQKELSCGYHYRADMTSGTYEGQPYDGVMRDIKGNHVALVREGRAGSDVVVGDSAPKESHMPVAKLSLMAGVAKGAVGIYLRPKLAADQKIVLAPLFKGITAKGWKSQKAKLAADIKAALKGKLAKDADVEDLVELLDSLDGEVSEMPAEDEEELEAGKKKPDGKENPEGEDDEGEGHSEEDETALWRQLHAMIGRMLADGEEREGEDEPPDFQGKPKTEAGEENKEMVSKGAMDAAMKKVAQDTETATIARINAIHDAKTVVEPFVGKLAGAFDSAAAVYRYALEKAGIDLKGVHESAFGPMVKMLPSPKSAHDRSQAQDSARTQAMDAGELSEFAKKFGPGITDVTVMN